MERYRRQIKLRQIGEEGQQRLKKARVAVIGTGGLGSPVLTYLTAAGIGSIRLIDGDTVSVSNFNRQFLHTEQELGNKKVESAAEALRKINSETTLELRMEWLTKENISSLLENVEVVVDCVDNLATRRIVNQYCVEKNIPLVEGGISGWYGYVTVVSGEESACLECMGLCNGKEQKEIPALGAVAGVIGSLQAVECIKIILGAGEMLKDRILQYDGILGEFDEIAVKRSEECSIHRKIFEK